MFLLHVTCLMESLCADPFLPLCFLLLVEKLSTKRGSGALYAVMACSWKKRRGRCRWCLGEAFLDLFWVFPSSSLTATGEISRGESVVASIETCHASGWFHVSMILHQNWKYHIFLLYFLLHRMLRRMSWELAASLVLRDHRWISNAVVI
jgi:hypothetical protein